MFCCPYTKVPGRAFDSIPKRCRLSHVLSIELYRTFACVVCSVLHSSFSLVVPRPRKVFNNAYMCFAAADEPLLLPSLERFKRLGIVDIAWRREHESNERESKRLIRESSVFQICWSISAKVRSDIPYI